MRYKIVKRAEWELMKKMVDRQDNYIEQISKQNSKISDLEKALEEFIQKYKKAAGRCGGLTKSVHSHLKNIDALNQKIHMLNNQVEFMTQEVKEITKEKDFYKNYTNPAAIEKYKNYIEGRREVDKRNKDRGVVYE